MTTQGPVRSDPAEKGESPLPPLAGGGGVPVMPPTPPPMRIGRVEREAADARLREALRDDVISITEYDERLGLVMRAKTMADLDLLLADLPGAAPQAQADLPSLPECSSIVAVMGNEEQRGRWRPANPLRVVATMGSAVVDLREAVPSGGGFVIDAKAMMGNITVVVADDARVNLTGFAVMGEKKNRVAPPMSATGPTVEVSGHAVMGSVEVRTANRRERRRMAASSGPGAPAPITRALGPAGGRSWLGKAVAVGALAVLALVPARAVATADAVAIFGSRQYQPDEAQLAGDDDIDVLSMFGSVEVIIPADRTARLDVLPLFGSAECEDACNTTSDRPAVEVSGTVLFGSADVHHPEPRPE